MPIIPVKTNVRFWARKTISPSWRLASGDPARTIEVDVPEEWSVVPCAGGGAVEDGGKMSTLSGGLTWVLDDEPQNRQYVTLLIFDPPEEEDDPSRASLVDVMVLEVRHFDAQGNVVKRETGAQARLADDRAWRLLQQDSALLEHLEETAVQTGSRLQPVFATDVASSSEPSPTAETLSRLAELRKQLSKQLSQPGRKRQSG